MYLVVMVVIVMIIGYGGMRVANGTMSTGALVAFLLYLFQIIFPITSFAMFFTQLQKAKGATERIIDILELPLEEGQDGLEMDIANKPIQVVDVSFAYEDGDPVIETYLLKRNLVKWSPLQDRAAAEKQRCSVYWNGFMNRRRGKSGLGIRLSKSYR